MSARRGLWWRVVRFGFHLLYEELAWTYDLVSRVVSLNRWRAWQRAALPHLAASPGSRVLELAHGTANLQLDMGELGLKPVGVDRSRTMGRIARRKLRAAGVSEPQLARADARALPFPAAAFDAVVSTFPTEFIVEPATLREAARVLRPGGRLVIVFNGVLLSKGAVSRVLEWLYRVTGQREPWPGDPLARLSAAGFDTELITEYLPGSAVTLAVCTLRPSPEP